MSSTSDTPIFNSNGRDDINPLWGGNPTGLIKLTGVNCRNWARSLYERMNENFWIPHKVNLLRDVQSYPAMTSPERRAYEGMLSYLTFLDSIQTVNIPKFSASMTSPEVRQLLAAHTFQEAIHNDSYRYIIESLIPTEDHSRVYDFWRTDLVLKERCEFIAGLYQGYLDQKTNRSYLQALIANYLLESLYFYGGFTFFGVLALRQVMPGTGDMFSLIRRDEQVHCTVFGKILKEAFQYFSDEYSSDMVYDMFDEAVRQEGVWAEHIIGDGIVGIHARDLSLYTQYWANSRLKEIGLEPQYDVKENPFSHIDRFYDQTLGGSAANFFESTVTSYVTTIPGLEEIRTCEA